MKRRLCVLLAMSLIMTSAGGPTVYGYEEAAISVNEQEDAAISDVQNRVSELDGAESELIEVDDVYSWDDLIEKEGTLRAPQALCFQGEDSFELGRGVESVAYRKSGELGRQKLSQKDIIAMYNDIPEMTADTPERFSEEPSSVSPYEEGKLSKDYLNAALSYLNYIRSLSGLRGTKLNDGLNASAQQAALVNAANGGISHTPSKPSGMSNSLYEKGYAAAGSSNLYKHTNKANSTLLKTSLISYMDDNNSGTNLECLGHRRWVTYPNLAYTGFGQAEKGTIAIGAMKDFKSKYDSVNPADSTSINYDFISWPSSGNFPIHKSSSFGVRNAENLMTSNVPWSVTLNPKKYKIPSAGDLTIKVTRQSDGKVWNFTKADVNSSPTSKKTKYMLVNKDNYGISNCIIFNLGSEFTDVDYNRRADAPDEKEQLFSVCISGLKTASGASTQINYRVNFFDIADPDTTSPYYDSGVAFDETEETLPPEVTPVDDSEPVDLIENEVKPLHTVSFVCGTTVLSQVTVAEGDLLCEIMKDLENPMPSSAGLSDDNYGFMGWYSQGDSTGLTAKGCLVDGATAVSGDITVYAYFKARIPGVTPISLDSRVTPLEIGTMKSVEYDGTYQTPEVTLKIGKTVLCRGEDYLLNYANNKEPGEATVTIMGIGDYSGTKTTSFRITKRAISKADVWFEDVNGVSSITSVNDERIRGHYVDFGATLTGEDYSIDSVACVPNANGGKVTVIVNGTGSKYTGSVKCVFNCYSAAAGVQLISNGSDSGFVQKMKLDSTADYDSNRKCYVYTGSAIKPTVSIPGLTPKTDYTLKYRNNKNAGMGVIIISGKGAYKGTYRLYFPIGKRDISSGSVAPIPTKTYKGAAQRIKPKVSVYTTAKTLKLKAKKDYTTVYSDAINAGNCSVTIQGIKNYMGTLTTSFEIAPASVSKIKFSGLEGMESETGFALTGTIMTSFGKKKGLIEGYDYELGDVSYDSMTGTATVEVKGLHNFTNTAQKKVKVIK